MTALRGRIATVIGVLVTIAALGAFAKAFIDSVSTTDIGRLIGDHWIGMLASAGIYLAAFAPMTLGWIVLARTSGIAAPAGALTRIFLVSQIAKYLPGNVGHLLGRMYMSSRYGIAPVRTGIAIGLELTATLLACLMLILLLLVASSLYGIPYRIEFMNNLLFMRDVHPISLILFIFVLIGGVLFLRNKTSILDALPRFIFGTLMISLAITSVAGCSLLILSMLSEPPDLRGALLILSVFLVSWFAGFVTPGSPAGIGVREFAFLSLLQAEYPADLLVLTIAALRLVTVVGDLIAWCAGLALGALSPSARPTE